jgi:NAD(P)-dependent dehydrogenase (short-subunit alcohol dehydrogenase family)
MSMRFDGRVALITGSARGVGRAYAQLLAAGGATVVLNDLLSPPDPGAMTADALQMSGGQVEFSHANVGRESEALALAERVLNEHGRLDIFVHNATTATGTLQENLDLQVRSVIWILRNAWPEMVRRRFGRVVIATSAAGLFGGGGAISAADARSTSFGEESLDGSADAGAVGLMRHLAVRGQTANVTCNAIVAGDCLASEAVAPLLGYLVHESAQVSGEIYRAEGPSLRRDFVAQTPGYANDQLTIEDVQQHIAEICDTTQYSVPGLSR